MMDHIFFYIMGTTRCMCVTNGLRKHYGNIASQLRQCDALSNIYTYIYMYSAFIHFIQYVCTFIHVVNLINESAKLYKAKSPEVTMKHEVTYSIIILLI